MKKIVYLITLAILAGGCASEPHYVVKGKIEGSDKIIFYMQKREAGRTITIDSAISRKGRFTMKGGTIDYPQLIQLVAGDTRNRTSFYLENSKIGITGSLDSLFKATIKGSETHDEYRSFVDSNKPLSEVYSSTYLEYHAANQAGNTERMAQLEIQIDSIQTEMRNLQKNFVRDNPASYVTPSILGSISHQMEADEIESMINGLNSEIAGLPQVKALKERVEMMKAVAIGKKAPDFTMNDAEGNPVSLKERLGSGLLLLDFWAAWCGPCRQENPHVVKVYKDFNKKGFDVFGVSLDQKKEDWIKAIADDDLTWTHVSDLQYWGNEAAKMYAVSSIPSNFLLDESGTIIAKNLRGQDLYDKVNEILGTKK
jgi:peroxiredoxin